MKPAAQRKSRENTLIRGVFFVLGLLCMTLAILGVFVPGMPTTVFVLLAGYFWARSSRRFYAWLLRHKLFGKILKDWQQKRAMPRFAKYLAWGMMGISSASLFFLLPMDKWWIAQLVATLCLGVAFWMARLPDA